MAGYSGTPLQKKLGIKEEFRCRVANAPENYFDLISPLPSSVQFVKTGKELDFIHIFVKEEKIFSKAFIENKKLLSKNGMMWISWPKKSSKVPTDLDENIIRDFGLEHGLVDVKVCAVDDVWSGLKFVYRVADR